GPPCQGSAQEGPGTASPDGDRYVRHGAPATAARAGIGRTRRGGRQPAARAVVPAAQSGWKPQTSFRASSLLASFLTNGGAPRQEQALMSKPSRPFAKPLRELLGKLVGDAFARQGFASAEWVTRWDDIVGHEIAAHSEPIKLQWPRRTEGEDSEAGTLVLRVEGPAAIEIQHLAALICERVNRFLGWRGVGLMGEGVTGLRGGRGGGGLALRRAPWRRRQRRPPRAMNPAATTRIAENLSDIKDEALKQALARLGAAVSGADRH